MEDGLFDDALAGIVVDGSTGYFQKQRKLFPAHGHVIDGEAEASVRFDGLFLKLFFKPFF